MYLLQLFSEFKHHLKCQTHTAAIFLDLQKAFDSDGKCNDLQTNGTRYIRKLPASNSNIPR